MRLYLKTIFTTLLFSFALCTTIQASNKGEKTIYAFVYGTCFNDSTVYISAIERIANAETESKTGFLVNRSDYANALKKYLDQKYKKPHTCTVFYATKRDKIEKKYVKIRHVANRDKHCKLVEIPVTDFKLTHPNTEQ